jgi:Outer membrane protein
MIAKREIVADHAENTVAVRFAVQSGPVAVFGPTEIIGLDEVLESYVMDERAWEQGAPFDRRLVEKTRET